MSASNVSEPRGLAVCDEPNEVVEFCMQCPFDDCISSNKGCEEARKIRKAALAGEEYHPPDDWWVGKSNPQALLDKAWEKLDNAKRPAPKKTSAKPKEPAMMLEELPMPSIKHDKLHHYNEAIRALEVLHDTAFGIGPAISEMIVTIKTDRSSRFDHLIDWDAVARGGRT